MSNERPLTCALSPSISLYPSLPAAIPKDSLQWSADGSKGIYSKDGALFIVDGNTGSYPRSPQKKPPLTGPPSRLTARSLLLAKLSKSTTSTMP